MGLNVDRLSVGDLIETTGVLGNLSSEELVLQVIRVQDKPTCKEVEFNATYFGVCIGQATCTSVGGSLSWGWK